MENIKVSTKKKKKKPDNVGQIIAAVNDRSMRNKKRGTNSRKVRKEFVRKQSEINPKINL